MTINSWEELMALDDADYVNVPVGDTTVRLGTLSSAEMLQWLEDNDDVEKHKTNGLVLVAKCLVNERGERIGNLADMLKLRSKQPKTVKKLVRAAIELNDLNVKEPEKNDSGGAPLVASPTATVS